MKRSILLATLVLLLAGGCGYHAPGKGDAWVGGTGRTLCVELFANRTIEPYLDSVMTDEVSSRLARSRLVELTEERDTADLVLGGTVTGFESIAVAYDDDDDISEYSARMTVQARLARRSDGVVLWQGELTRSESYPALEDRFLLQEGEALAARVAARHLAEDLVARLLDAF